LDEQSAFRVVGLARMFAEGIALGLSLSFSCFFLLALLTDRPVMLIAERPALAVIPSFLLFVALLILGVAVFHEGVHIVVARLAGIRGLRLESLGWGISVLYRGGIPKRQFLAISLSPSAVSVALLVIAHLFHPGDTVMGYLRFLALLSIVGSGCDVAVSLRVLRAPAESLSFTLFDESDSYLGGVLESDPPTVFLVRRANVVSVRREGEIYVATVAEPARGRGIRRG